MVTSSSDPLICVFEMSLLDEFSEAYFRSRHTLTQNNVCEPCRLWIPLVPPILQTCIIGVLSTPAT